MRPKPRNSPRPKIFQSPAAAAAAASVTAAYALSKSGKLEFSEMEDLNMKLAQQNGSQRDLASDINAIREEKKMLESALEKVRTENSSFKGKIDETTGSHADLSKVCIEIDYVCYKLIINQIAQLSIFLPIFSRNSTRSKVN